MSRPPQHGGAVPLRARTTTPGLPRGPSGSRLAPLANRLHLNHGGCGAHGGGGAARSLAPLPRPHPRRHLPQLALHRGLRLHARQGEPGGGGGARGGGWQRLPLTPPPLFSFSPSPPGRRWRRPASCTAPARTAPTWRSASSASRSWRAGSPTTTRCEERGRCPGGEGAGEGRELRGV